MNYRKFFQEIQLATLIISLIGLKLISNQTTKPESPQIDPKIYQLTVSRLALGEQLYSKNLTQIDLEKIPLVSSSIAEAIVKQENQAPKPNQSNIERLEAIKGIGVKKAQIINRYLLLD